MISPSNSILLLIDVQGDLAEAMHGKEELFKNLQVLLKAAKILNIPVICTEQAPDKLGPTNASLSALLPNIRPIPKKTFSCWGNSRFRGQLKKFKRKNIVICGIESHVCVYQTAADLLKAKYNVQVVLDAVSSRTLQNKWAGLDRMKGLGAELTSTEMLATEMLASADHPKFRQILQLIK